MDPVRWYKYMSASPARNAVSTLPGPIGQWASANTMDDTNRMMEGRVVSLSIRPFKATRKTNSSDTARRPRVVGFDGQREHVAIDGIG